LAASYPYAGIIGESLFFNSDPKGWPQKFVVKFSRMRYGWEAHLKAQHAGHAPILLGVTQLCLAWVAMAMEYLEDWDPLDNYFLPTPGALYSTI
jgi:hypothetical protein